MLSPQHKKAHKFPTLQVKSNKKFTLYELAFRILHAGQSLDSLTLWSD